MCILTACEDPSEQRRQSTFDTKHQKFQYWQTPHTIYSYIYPLIRGGSELNYSYMTLKEENICNEHQMVRGWGLQRVLLTFSAMASMKSCLWYSRRRRCRYT